VAPKNKFLSLSFFCFPSITQGIYLGTFTSAGSGSVWKIAVTYPHLAGSKTCRYYEAGSGIILYIYCNSRQELGEANVEEESTPQQILTRYCQFSNYGIYVPVPAVWYPTFSVSLLFMFLCFILLP